MNPTIDMEGGKREKVFASLLDGKRRNMPLTAHVFEMSRQED
jgi:hypothetical protein